MRLIDADAIPFRKEFGDLSENPRMFVFKSEFDRLPTIEVKDLIEYHVDEISRTFNYKVVEVDPVVHGRWEVTVLESSDRCIRTGPPHCSVCGQKAPRRTPFCPNCGAHMDEEVF